MHAHLLENPAVKPRWSATLVLLGMLVFQTSPSLASYIGLRLNFSASVTADLFVLKAKISNTGDEAAFELAPVLWIGEDRVRLSGGRKLSAGKELTMSYSSLDHPFSVPGSYHLPMHLRYRDVAGAAYKLAVLIRVDHGEASEAGLAWQEAALSLPADDSIQVSLRNLDDRDKQVMLSGITSMDIELGLPVSPLTLGAGEERTWELSVSHDDLLPNRYPNFLVASYIQDGVHYSEPLSIETEAVMVQNAPFGIFTPQNLSLALFMLLLVALVGGYGPRVVRKLWQKRS